jgi:small subunit ribosomal protein S21
MLIVNVGKSDNIDKALKTLKKKFTTGKILEELRNRKEFEKPSSKNRREKSRYKWNTEHNL